MKLSVKRNRVNSFEKAKIEIENIDELSTLRSAISFYEKHLRNNGMDNAADKHTFEVYTSVLNAMKALEIRDAKTGE